MTKEQLELLMEWVEFKIRKMDPNCDLGDFRNEIEARENLLKAFDPKPE